MSQPAMSEARRYQQLRAHLSYLRLASAAEALSAILDQARTGRLSLTAALERLLEIEVTATESERLKSGDSSALLRQVKRTAACLLQA